MNNKIIMMIFCLGALILSHARSEAAAIVPEDEQGPISQLNEFLTREIAGYLLSKDNAQLAATSSAFRSVLQSELEKQNLSYYWVKPLVERRLENLGGPITSISFSPNGKLIAASARLIQNYKSTGIITLFNASNRVKIKQFPGANFSLLAFSPDNQSLVSASFFDGTAILWDAIPEKEKYVWDSDQFDHGSPDSVQFSPEGTLFVISSKYVKYPKQNWQLWQININTRKNDRIGDWEADHLGLSPNCKILATVRHKLVFLKNLETNTEIRLRFASQLPPVFSHDSTMVATIWDNECTLYNAITGEIIKEFIDNEPNEPAAFSPDGKVLVTRAKNKINLWSVASGKKINTLETSRNINTRPLFSPDGKTLAAGDNEGTIFLWSQK